MARLLRWLKQYVAINSLEVDPDERMYFLVRPVDRTLCCRNAYQLARHCTRNNSVRRDTKIERSTWFLFFTLQSITTVHMYTLNLKYTHTQTHIYIYIYTYIYISQRTKVTKSWHFTTVWRSHLRTDLNQMWYVHRSHRRSLANKMVWKYQKGFPDRQVEKYIFPFRKSTACITLPCATTLVYD